MLLNKKANHKPFNASQIQVPVRAHGEGIVVMPHMEDVPTSVINETQVVVASTKTSRKSRVELTIQQKLNVCAAIDNGKMQHVIAKEYKLEVSTVRKLFKKKQFVRLGYGRKYQYHPPTKNRELYEQGAETEGVTNPWTVCCPGTQQLPIISA